MIRIAFRIPEGASLKADLLRWRKRYLWLDKLAEGDECYLDTAWADYEAGRCNHFVILVPGAWAGSTGLADELRKWITELGFEIVEEAQGE